MFGPEQSDSNAGSQMIPNAASVQKARRRKKVTVL